MSRSFPLWVRFFLNVREIKATDFSWAWSGYSRLTEGVEANRRSIRVWLCARGMTCTCYVRVKGGFSVKGALRDHTDAFLNDNRPRLTRGVVSITYRPNTRTKVRPEHDTVARNTAARHISRIVIIYNPLEHCKLMHLTGLFSDLRAISSRMIIIAYRVSTDLFSRSLGQLLSCR